ncbi:MAG: hypothetical protein GX227_07150 [Clostridiaceae bacterium]|jgi:hypothetical protein|nr:hypothetical protein [Clostridiaceae bacterium]
MAVKLLDGIGRNLIEAKREEMKAAIISTGGRVIIGETVTFKQSLIDGVTNVELLKSWGADMVTINHYNVEIPMIPGLPSTKEGIELWGSLWNISGAKGCIPDIYVVEPSFQNAYLQFGFGRTINEVKKLAGIPVGMTLEPVEPGTGYPEARIANRINAKKGVEQGANYVTIINTPSMPSAIFAKCVSDVREGVEEDGLVKAGKMPWGGAFPTDPDYFYTTKELKELISAGADVILIPSPGTVTGLTIDLVRKWVNIVHENGALAEITIGTSQEGADEEVICRFAIDSKMTGADIFQIGDSVYSGTTTPENLMAFSKSIKGRRHTLKRMALSPMRGELL